MIENTQKKFLKYLHFKRTANYPHLIPYQELLINFDVDSLEIRRKIDAMKFLFKIINNSIDDSEFLSLLNFHVPRINSRNNITFEIKRTRTSGHKNSPLNRLCYIFNTVAQRNNAIDFSTSLTVFLMEFLTTLLK